MGVRADTLAVELYGLNQRPRGGYLVRKCSKRDADQARRGVASPAARFATPLAFVRFIKSRKGRRSQMAGGEAVRNHWWNSNYRSGNRSYAAQRRPTRWCSFWHAT